MQVNLGKWQLFYCLFFSFSVMAWTSVHHVIAVETYLKIGKSVIAIQRAFPCYFMSCQNDMVTAWTGAHWIFAAEIFLRLVNL